MRTHTCVPILQAVGSSVVGDLGETFPPAFPFNLFRSSVNLDNESNTIGLTSLPKYVVYLARIRHAAPNCPVPRLLDSL